MGLADGPARLGHYELQELLGERGMARVYRARDTRLEREVAVKVLRASVASSPRAAARFRREARLAASLRHPNVVTVHDCSADDEEQLYLVTELVQGGSLRQLLAERGPLLGEEAALLLLPVARALAAAHELGIVHRDVKPDNILLDRGDGEAVTVKLADFGVAVAGEEPRITTDGAVSGSVIYMAPELLRDGAASPATDIWAVGVTLAELVGGRPPFGPGTVGQVVARILALDGGGDPLQELPHAEVLAPELDALLRRCLDPRPGARPASGAELVRELEQALERAGIDRPDQELDRWHRDPGYRQALAARLAGELVRAARDASLTDRAELLDRALALVPDHADALQLLDGRTPPRASPRRLPWIFGVVVVIGVSVVLAALGLRRESPRAGAPAATPDQAATEPRDAAPPHAAADTGTHADHAVATAPSIPTRVTPHKTQRAPARPATRRRRGHGTVQLTTRPWAEVLVGKRSLGYTPRLQRFELPAGEQRVTLKNPLCKPRTLRLQIRPGETLLRHVELEVLPARLRVRAPAGWQIRVDGKTVGRTPLAGPLNLTHGAHQVVAVDPAGARHRRRVQLTAGKSVTLELGD